MELQKHFTKVNLPLVISKVPIGNFGNFAFMDESRKKNAFSIFQMTIDKDKRGKENFRIFPGDINNQVQVLDIDKDKEQLLLFVKEPKRSFQTETPEYKKGKKTGKMIVEKHTTDPAVRKYLMGMDETHLFISELPASGAINKVKDAFRILKPAEVKDRHKRKNKEAKRQGEWFFTEATPGELLEIKEFLKFGFIEQNVPIEPVVRGGKPHTADEIIRLGELKIERATGRFGAARERRIDNRVVFVRGKIRHDDHKTREIQGWHRVFRNTEKRDMQAVHGWID